MKHICVRVVGVLNEIVFEVVRGVRIRNQIAFDEIDIKFRSSSKQNCFPVQTEIVFELRPSSK
jgi:hypothetical protein